MRAVAAARLAKEIRERGHLTTGFLGTPYLCHVLSRYGYLDEAYLLLEPRRVPVVALPGDAGRDDDLGAVGRAEAGRLVPGQGDELVQPLRVRRHRRLDVPRHGGHRDRSGRARLQASRSCSRMPGGGFTSVKAAHESLYGAVASAWTLDNGAFALTVDVPAEHARDDAPAWRDASRRRDTRWQGARRMATA